MSFANRPNAPIISNVFGEIHRNLDSRKWADNVLKTPALYIFQKILEKNKNQASFPSVITSDLMSS